MPAARHTDNLRGTTLIALWMETVFHDVLSRPVRRLVKATHVAATCTRRWALSRNLALIDFRRSLRKLGISRKDLIECDGSQYPKTALGALGSHDQIWALKCLTLDFPQADPERAIVLFEDRLTGPALVVSGAPASLLLPDGSAISRFLPWQRLASS